MPRVTVPAGDRRWNKIEHADSERGLKAADKRARRKLSAASTTNTPTGFICSACSRDCRSRIGLYSHIRRCDSTTIVDWTSFRRNRHRLPRLRPANNNIYIYILLLASFSLHVWASLSHFRGHTLWFNKDFSTQTCFLALEFDPS